ncbi:MAG: diacylglycerol kinase family protein [Candidatus Omnitrophica bacterium]|nr:diacylglycerol kinase family protein [Candidatus Omnitrophota bacterium]
MYKRRLFREVFKLNGLRESFKFAIRGIVYLFLFHRNMRIIFLLGILALLLGFYFQLRGIELMILSVTIALVFMAEILNTTIELILDIFFDRYHPKVKIIKDISAAVVVITVLNSLAIGYILFVRKLIYFWK